MRQVEEHLGIDLREYLDDQYHGQGRRLVDIGTDLGVDIGTVSRWMDRLGIDRRVRTVAPKAAVA